jgi:hypothetical protein
MIVEDGLAFGAEPFPMPPPPVPPPPGAIGPGGGFVDGGFGIDGRDPRLADDGVPFWLWSAVVLGTVAAAAFFLAARRLQTPSARAS